MEQMSPRATARCRSLRIVNNNKGQKTKAIDYTFEVFDARAPSTAQATIRVRSVNDYFRVLRAWMARYRVPSVNVSGDVLDR